jgi:hypothetical protein
MPSTRDMSGLPNVEGLRRLLQSLAMLDAILSEDWESRYYSFNAHWAKGQMLGSMRNGSGDEFFAAFNQAGCFLKGFAHEAPMSPHPSNPPQVHPGVLDDVPSEFADFCREPAFNLDNTTFCIWRKFDDTAWHRGRVSYPSDLDPDGSEELLAILDNNPSTYKAWAEEYYGEDWDEDRQLEVENVARIYRHEPLTKELVLAINPERKLGGLTKDTKGIDYPSAR